jgi:ubiquinone/menaquinone biosynthesis C-methylase UbiE
VLQELYSRNQKLLKKNQGTQFGHSQFRSLDELQWLDVNLQVVNDLAPNLLPKLPSEDIQGGFVGSSGRDSLREGFNFYLACKGRAESWGVQISPDAQVLDFGMGWGRILRFWLKDVDSKNLWGVDVDANMVNLCTQLFDCCNFAKVEVHPPSGFESNKFHVIYAYSVFSHLPEAVGMQWIAEFSRILKPGGIVIATTNSRRFIKFCKSLREKPPERGEANPDWYAALRKSFIDTNGCLKAYDQGQFLYAATGGEYRPYGEAVFSGKYVLEKWSEYLALKEFVDDPHYLPQAMMVLQKR